MRDTERKAEKDSISKIEGYKKYQKHVYRRIEKERLGDPKPKINHSHLESELSTCIRELTNELLEIEINLQDALLTSRKAFFSKISSIIDEMKQLN